MRLQSVALSPARSATAAVGLGLSFQLLLKGVASRFVTAQIASGKVAITYLGGGDRSKFQAALHARLLGLDIEVTVVPGATENLQAVPSFEAAFWRRPIHVYFGPTHGCRPQGPRKRPQGVALTSCLSRDGRLGANVMSASGTQ